MTPEYLEELADMVDPEQLWRQSRLSLVGYQRKCCDAGVALRRHADHIRQLRDALAKGKSILITPLSVNGTATKVTETPPDHQKLRRPHG